MKGSVLLIQPFRKPSIKEIMVKNYPCWEIINTSPLVLAAILENEGYNVNFLNMQNMFKSYESSQKMILNELLSHYDPEVIIFHTDYYVAFTSTAVFYSIKIITDYYKRINKQVKIILVGRNGLALGKKVFDIDKNIDLVVKGECEDFILSLLEGVKNNNLRNVPNVIYKYRDEVIENEGIGTVSDINVLPTPAFHLLKESVSVITKISGLKMGIVPISIRTSFGCPMNCNYCSGISTWNDYHVKSKETIDREVKYFYDTFGEKGRILFFVDELFAYKLNHVSEVAEVFKKYNVKIAGLFAHSQLFNDEIAKKVKEISNCVVFGAENCCDEILAKANKMQTFESLGKAIKIAKQNELEVSLEWIVGLPGENIKTAAKNINTIYNMIVKGEVDNINTYIFCPYPNTEFSNNSEKYGIKINDSIDEMVEEGYPTYSLNELTSNQLFVYYLLTQLMIKEALLGKETVSENYEPMECNYELFEELLKKVVVTENDSR